MCGLTASQREQFSRAGFTVYCPNFTIFPMITVENIIEFLKKQVPNKIWSVNDPET